MKAIIATFGLSAALVAAASGVTVNVFPVDRGWWDSNDESLGTTDDSYFAGEAGTEAQLEGAGGREMRNFFVFDLSGIGANTILGATLRMLNPNVSEIVLGEALPGDNDPIIGNGFFSGDASETYEVTDFTLPGGTTLMDLTDSLSEPGMYAALGTGASYGSIAFLNPGDNTATSTFKDISLNATFLADANAEAGIGSIVIGGRVTTVDGDLTDTEWAFAWTDLNPAAYVPGDGNVVLILDLIPEPSSLGLLGLSAVLCLFRRRRS
jgi:hypothetical protein